MAGKNRSWRELLRDYESRRPDTRGRAVRQSSDCDVTAMSKNYPTLKQVSCIPIVERQQVLRWQRSCYINNREFDCGS